MHSSVRREDGAIGRSNGGKEDHKDNDKTIFSFGTFCILFCQLGFMSMYYASETCQSCSSLIAVDKSINYLIYYLNGYSSNLVLHHKLETHKRQYSS